MEIGWRSYEFLKQQRSVCRESENGRLKTRFSFKPLESTYGYASKLRYINIMYRKPLNHKNPHGRKFNYLESDKALKEIKPVQEWVKEARGITCCFIALLCIITIFIQQLLSYFYYLFWTGNGSQDIWNWEGIKFHTFVILLLFVLKEFSWSLKRPVIGLAWSWRIRTRKGRKSEILDWGLKLWNSGLRNY